jgi:short subunit dehydrogenase-like uncharacterized protein
MPKRSFDIIIYGATGYVGQQCAAYLQALPGVKLAIAGRDRAKLEGVRDRHAPEAEIIVAGAQDAKALNELASRTRVVLACAGPFAKYGSALVAACVDQGTHYVDITGETGWVRTLIDAHHEAANAKGLRIVPQCGFDSVPSDLGAWMLARELHNRTGEACVSARGAFSLKGGFNGGTLASFMSMHETGQMARMNELFLLNPAGTAPKNTRPHADPLAAVYDADFKAWIGPFVMGFINTRAVRRSAALWQADGAPMYGRDFAYQEYMRFGKGPQAAVIGGVFSAGSAVTRQAMRLAPLRSLASRFMPQPGEGPSEGQMDGGFFKAQFLGRTASGKTLRATVGDQGDPGNRATTKMVCESALALAKNEKDLPQHAGVITPSYAFGDVLLKRLRAAGMTWELKDADEQRR